MTSTTVNPLEQAAIPSAIAILLALKQFKTDLGTNPMMIPATAGPALMKFTATVELQAPALATTEWSAAGTEFDSKVDGWISSLTAKQAAPVTTTTTSAPALPG